MEEALDNQIVESYPHLYKNRYKSMQETCMCWGFDCDEGWFDLIDELSKNLEEEILKLSAEERIHYGAAQVKEKFGGLRFYMDCATDYMIELIDEAEKKSYTICEVCGGLGKLCSAGVWLKTLCKRCLKDPRFENYEWIKK